MITANKSCRTPCQSGDRRCHKADQSLSQGRVTAGKNITHSAIQSILPTAHCTSGLTVSIAVRTSSPSCIGAHTPTNAPFGPSAPRLSPRLYGSPLAVRTSYQMDNYTSIQLLHLYSEQSTHHMFSLPQPSLSSLTYPHALLLPAPEASSSADPRAYQTTPTHAG